MDFPDRCAPNILTSHAGAATCEKPSPTPSTKPTKRRNRAAISQAMSTAAGMPPARLPKTSDHKHHDAPGLTLRDLEDCRWNISPSLARQKLLQAGLPYEGRRAGLIYSWASIFLAEGLAPKFAKTVTADEHPDLFDNLLDTTGAAALLGYRDASTIRKFVASGRIGPEAYLTFGRRGVYRFRPRALEPLRKALLAGRIV